MSFFKKVQNVREQETIEQVVYRVLTRIPFATGPTGARSISIINSNGVLSKTIIPETNNIDIGTNELALNSLNGYNFVFDNSGSIFLAQTGDAIDMTSGSTIGGVVPGSIIIKGTLSNSSDLPSSGNNPGDGYMISPGNNLWIFTIDDGWVQIGDISGDIGLTGPQGIIGCTGYIRCNGYVRSIIPVFKY